MSAGDDVIVAFERYIGQGSGFPGPNMGQRRYGEVTNRSVGGVDYCVFTLVAAAADAGQLDKLSRSGVVSDQVLAMKERGTWYSFVHTPQRGDVIVFCWDKGRSTSASSMDLTAIARETWHIGIVVDFDGSTVTTLEANNDDATGYHTYRWDSSVIYGYGRPFEGASQAPTTEGDFLMALSQYDQELMRNAIVDINNRTADLVARVDKLEKTVKDQTSLSGYGFKGVDAINNSVEGLAKKIDALDARLKSKA